jgi:O-methyltransferase domain
MSTIQAGSDQAPASVAERFAAAPAEAPPPVQMFQLLAGFQVSQALYAVAVLGVADALIDGPRPIPDLAQAAGLHEPALRRLLRFLASLGVFTEPAPGQVALTPLGRTLAGGHPESMRDVAITWMETHYAAFSELAGTIRTGQPAFDRYHGMPVFEWFAAHPADAATFSRAMTNMADGIRPGVVASLRLDGIATLVDVGGADGALLAAILASHAGMTGILLDLPHVADNAAKALARRGVSDRVTCVGGDFFESVPASDGYLLSFVLHDWDDASVTRILRNIATAGGPGAQVVVIEGVIPPGEQIHMLKTMDLTMLGMTTGRERGESEWRKLLTASGLDRIEIIPTPTPLSIIRAVIT